MIDLNYNKSGNNTLPLFKGYNHDEPSYRPCFTPHGEPQAENFRLEEAPLPSINDDQVLLKTIYLSLNPYMRGHISDAPSYAPPC